MKERLITLVCALGALALFVALFVRSESSPDAGGAVPRPTTADRGGNGYYAAMRWLTGESVPAISLRVRLDRLAGKAGLSPSGNLLIITLPAPVSFRSEEIAALGRWVRKGNTLLVLAALADQPDWACVPGSPPAADLGLLTGLELEPVAPAAAGAPPGRHPPCAPPPAHTRGTLVPNRPDVYLDGVQQAVALSDHAAWRWRVKLPRDGFVLSLASQRETGEGVLWTRSLGRGRVIVSGFGSLFAARTLGLADNARLLANIVSATVGARGAVLFDDLHQGLGEAHDPARLYTDPRLYRSAAILAAVWLAWVLGSTRLRVAAARAPAPRQADLVRATGGLLARALRRDAAALGLLEHFFRRARARSGGGGVQDAPVWELLARHPRVSREDLEQLKEWYLAARAARHVPLMRLHNLIRRIEQQMAA